NLAIGALQLTADLGGSASSPKVAGLQGIAISSTAPTSGQCLTYSGSNWVPGACGSASLPGGANTQVEFNNSGSFGGSANLTWVSPELTIGAAGSATGQLALAGTTSGVVTVQSQAAAGTYNFNLPTVAGTSGQPLLSGGGGASPMTFGTLGAAGGGTGITSGTSGGVLCFTGAASIASSAALTSGQLVTGGGAGACPSVGNLSGDVTTSGSTATTAAKVHGVLYPAGPATNTVPVVTAANTVTYEAVPNAALANSSVTVNTSSPLTGGGSAALGGNLSLTCTNCVTGSSLASGQLVTGGGSSAVAAGNLSGDVTTSGSTATTLSKIQGNTVSLTSLNAGDLFYWSGTQWTNGKPGMTVNLQSGTSYTVQGTSSSSSGDLAKLLSFSNSAAVAVTLPQCGSAGFGNGFVIYVHNRGSGTVTVTPTTSTVDGAASVALTQGQKAAIACNTGDGNYYTW